MANRLLKKLLSLGLSATVCLSLFAACGAPAETSTPDSPSPAPSDVATDSATTEEPIEPKYKFEEPIELSTIKEADAFFMYTEQDTPSDNIMYDLWEETMGIKWVNKIETATEAYDQRVKTAILSEDLPDLIGASAADFEVMIENDMLEDLTPYLEYFEPEILEKFNSFDGALFAPVTKDGKIYGIPATSNVEGSLRTMWIRKDWLEAVDAEVPTTMEEVFELAEKFTLEDPDGNGIDDTYGLPISKDPLELVNTYEIVANAFGYYPLRTVLDENGDVTLGSLDPGLKDVLQMFQDLYSIGGIDPEFAAKDFMQVDESVAANKIGLWLGVFWKPVDPGMAATYEAGVEWIQAPIPASETVGEYKPFVAFPANAWYGIRKGYEYPEAIMVAANNMLSSDYTNEFLVKSREIAAMPEYAGFNTNNWVKLQFQDPVFFNSSPLQRALDDPDFNPDEPAYQIHGQAYDMITGLGTEVQQRQFTDIFLNSVGIHESYPTENYVFDAYFGPQVPTLAEQGSILRQMEEEVLARVISGIDDVSAYDDFIAEHRAIGGDQIIAEMNEAVS